MRKYLKNKKKKSDNFFTKLFNGFVTLCLTLAMLWGLQAYSTSTGLKFAQLSDVHFSDSAPNSTFKMLGDSGKILDDAINQINEEDNLDFVMITGDLIDTPFEKELRAVLSHLDNFNNIPWYFAFGNHDRCVGGYLTTSVYMKMLKDSNKNYKFNTPYYSFTPKKGFKVIVLDNIITDKITSQGYIGEDQYSWLKKELDKSSKNTVLIFMHIPVIEPFPSPGHRLKNSSQIMSLIESYKNPIGVFQGHYHAAKITQRNNVLYVNSPALASYPNAFRIVNVTNYKDKTTFEFRWMETKLANVQKMSKILVLAPSVYEGDKQDREGIFEIKK